MKWKIEGKKEAPQVRLRAVKQSHWVYGYRKSVETVFCPKSGKICAIGLVCTGHKIPKYGYDIIKEDCEYFVRMEQGDVICNHPKAASYANRDPWKETDFSELPLFQRRDSDATDYGTD